LRPIPYAPARVDPEECLRRADGLLARMEARRSVRMFSPDPVPRGLVERAIQAASTAPSGAHRQPWTFVAVSNPDVKRQIRVAAEEEEKAFYEERAPEAWLEALLPFGTTWQKPYLETVPWLVVLFAQRWGVDADGGKIKNYYVTESCGIAAGLFVSAVHEMGLATLTHTPSPMGFLSEVLGRPENEKPLVLFPVGYPSLDATVPDLTRKSLEDVAVFIE
jgi:iodotyrosine deiodinase